MNLQMLKKAMLAYVSAVKFVWSSIVYPLSIVGKKLMNLRGYRVYGNSYQSPVGGKNMFYQKGTIKTINGVTVTYDEETQEFTLNGTSTESHNIIFSTLPIRFKKDTSYTLSITNTSGTATIGDGTGITYAYTIITSDSSMYRRTSTELTKFPQVSQFTFTNAFNGWTGNYQIMLQSWRIGTVFDNYKIKIQIEECATNTEWESYKSAPSPEYPSAIESVGDLSTKNLCTAQAAYQSTKTDYAYTEVEYDGRNCVRFVDCTEVKNTPIEFKENTQYTVQLDFNVVPRFNTPDSNTDTVFVFWYTDGTRTSSIIGTSGRNQWVHKTVTSTSGKTVEAVGIATYNYTCYVYVDINTFQLEEGTTATEYEPYHKYKIPIVARGRNLIPAFTFKTFTQNGVTFTNNKDGSITINGTPTGYIVTPLIYLSELSKEVLRNNVCAFTGFYKCSSGNIVTGLDAYLGGTLVKQFSLNKYTTNYIKIDLRSIEFDSIRVYVKRESDNKLIDNVTVKPFLEVGTTMPTSFEPYIAPVTTNIFLDEPLRKVGDYADYVDFERQKVVRNIEVLDDTGTKTIDESLGVINPPTEEPVNLPALPQFKGTTIYEVGTNIKPSGMEAKYC